MSDVALIEYLYGLHTGEDLDGHVVTRVIPFRVAKKTARRIYYFRDRWVDDGTGNGRRQVGYVDRQQMEASGDEGHWARKTAGWWEPDNRLFLSPPPIAAGRRLDPSALKAELDRLRTEMAAAHPDHGGTDAGFIAARKRYDAARTLFRRSLAVHPETTRDGLPDTQPVPNTPNHTDRGDTA